jgi:hypothetical protein
VAEIVVTHVSMSRGPKDDARDAFALAEQPRTHAVTTPVFKQLGAVATLRQLAKTHATVVQATVRVQRRSKALFRARGIAVAGKAVYNAGARAPWLAQLPASSRGAGEVLFAQYDAHCAVRDRAHTELVAESHRHPITPVLETCPGLGGIRVAQLVAIVITPERFRTRQQFWSYCGLGIVSRSSSDWVQTPKGTWARAQVQQTRGLNLNHNHPLKNVFKDAATTVMTHHPDDPLHAAYARLLANGTKPNLAKLMLARKLAALALAMWKRTEAYDPARHTPPPSSLVSGPHTARSAGKRRRVRA